MRNLISLASSGFTATVSKRGAQLQSLVDGEGRDLLWHGDPRYWKGRAPILFPVIGTLHNGGYKLDGRHYDMPKHGFARDRLFEVAQHQPGAATFTLRDDAETRALYPFAFVLEVHFVLQDSELSITATVRNTGEDAMPFSFGFHPAFRWPLPFDAPRSAHRIRFGKGETVPLRRIDAEGFLRPESLPTPIADSILTPDDRQFEEDAMIFSGVESRFVRYGAPGQPALDVAFPDMDVLGIWTKPGAPFLCIEPWSGISEPQNWEGDFREKPGSQLLAPGEDRRFTMSIAQQDDFDAD